MFKKDSGVQIVNNLLFLLINSLYWCSDHILGKKFSIFYKRRARNNMGSYCWGKDDLFSRLKNLSFFFVSIYCFRFSIFDSNLKKQLLKLASRESYKVILFEKEDIQKSVFASYHAWDLMGFKILRNWQKLYRNQHWECVIITFISYTEIFVSFFGFIFLLVK